MRNVQRAVWVGMWWMAAGVEMARPDTACAPCHPAQTKAFASSPMGRSMTTDVPVGGGQFRHVASDTRFEVQANGGLSHLAERAGFRARYAVEFAIGSGAHAQGYVVRIGGKLFQSPVAWYGAQRRFDAAPGYEGMAAPDFNRPVKAECLLCHSSPAEGGNRQAITCDRCHGEATAHLRRPVRGTIVNPGKLAAAARDSICEQCHLNGEARVLNPGAGFEGFVPGERLEDRYSVFVYDLPRGGLKVVSHAEQLALSVCQKATAKLWCGTCHAVHGARIDVSAQCRQCHESLGAEHPNTTQACAGCHMPKRSAKDGGHTAFTDHRIQKTPSEGGDVPKGLRAWREPGDPGVRQRNLGLAYIMAGERDGSAEWLNRGYALLAQAYAKFPGDADVLASLGMVLYLKDQKTDAAKLLRAAIAARPGDAGLEEKLGVIMRSKEALEKAIALDPSRETAYHLLADLQATEGERRATLERYLRFNPQSLIAREALAKLRRP